jgi:hypothetical protein
MRQGELWAAKRITKKSYLTLRHRFYELNQNEKKSSGNEEGVGIEAPDFTLFALIDKSGQKSRLGFDLQKDYSLFSLHLFRKNAVYDKRTYCSKELMHTGISLFGTSRLFGHDLWARVDLATIGSDFEKTLMFDYTLFEYALHDTKLISSLNGWYQFHSHTSDCYYSPKKSDATMTGLQWRIPFFGFLLQPKTNIGYNFWQKSLLYDVGFSLEYQKKSVQMQFECGLSNSSPVSGAGEYRAFECGVRIGKFL